MKKTLSIILSLVIVASMIVLSVNTATATTENTNYNINISNKEKYVSSREVTNDENKEDITMILVIGQSNSTTEVGYPCGLQAIKNGHRTEVTEVTTTPEKNKVYMAKYGQTITELNDSNDVVTLIENGEIGGYSSALGTKWNELTGEKVVLVQAAVGASGMHEWVKDNTKYNCTCGHNNSHYVNAVNQYNACYNALKDNYNIKHSFYIWNQGEHDELYSTKNSVDINSKEKYFEAYKSMHEDLLADLPLDFGGINIVRSHYHGNSMYLTVARSAQYRAANELPGCYMASRFFENCTPTDMDQTVEGSSGIHATQNTYNKLGTDAATNLYNAVIGNNNGLKSIELIKNISSIGVIKSRFNGNGVLVAGSDTLSKGEEIEFAAVPCGNYSLSFSVDGDNTKVDEFGIPVDSVFSDSDEVKISFSADSDVVLSSEQEVPTTTITGNDSVEFYQITNVSTAANWQLGWWNMSTGALEDYGGGNTRAALKKKVQVEYGTTYKLELKNNTIGIKYVLREYKQDGSFLQSFGTVESGGTYTPSSASVGFVSLTVYDNASAYYLIAEGSIVPSMTVYGSTSTTTTTNDATTTTTTTAATTSKNFIFSEDYASFSSDDITAGFKFDTSMAYPCVHSEWNKDLSAGTSVTITTKETVEPGIYDVKLFTRDASPRALIDISINGVVVAQSLDTTSSSIIENNSHQLKTIAIPASTVLTIKVTVAEAGKNVYLNSLTLTKTADYTTALTSAVATEEAASIRLNNQNGIRFYTTVDETALETLVNGTDYEIGTIVAPANALGTYGELTHALGKGNFAEIKYEARTADGKIEYFNAENKEIVGSLVSIRDGNISREFMARAYVKFGETYYYSTTTSTRSLKTVALAMQNDTANFSQLNEAQQAMVNAWAAGNPVTAE